MSFNFLANPSGRRTTTGYTAFGGTIGQDTNADTYVRASATQNPANLGLTLESMTIGAGKLVASTTYTYSATIYGSATSVNLRVAGTGVSTTDSSIITSGAFTRTSVTFTTSSSGTVSFYVINNTTAAATNVVSFRDAMVEVGSSLNAYYDGNSTNYIWTAAPDNSPTYGPAVTVFANTVFTPPRNEVSVSIPPGYVMNSATLNRVADGVPTPVRTQPATGFDSRIVYDYETPYDQSVAYQFTTNFTNPNGITTVWDETFASLSAWSGGTSGWAVSSGIATGGDGTLSTYTINRSLPILAKYRVVVGQLGISGINVVSASGSGVFLKSGSTTVVQVAPTIGGNLQIIRGSKVTVTPISGSLPFTIDMLDATIVVAGTGGSYSFASNSPINTVSLVADQPGNTSVGRITVGSYPTAFTASATSDALVLSPPNSWMIHPSNPSLSVPISSQDLSTATVRTIGDVTNPSNTTEHQILGQPNPITTNSGPRLSSRLTIVIGTKNTAQEQSLVSLLNDGTPVLFRFPASFNIGFDDGFYSVGDMTRSRFAQRPGDALRNFTLPLTQVQSPVVIVQNAGWSWAALAAQFSTWAQVSLAFNTWADVLTNNRNPGY